MSYSDFNKDNWVIVKETAVDILAGGFKLSTNMELEYLLLFPIIEGITPTVEKIKVELHADATYSSLLTTSEWRYLSDLSMATTHWSGAVWFKFDRFPLSSYQYYYVRIISSGYTHNNTTEYIAIRFDWPDRSGSITDLNPANRPLKMEILGYF